MSHAEPAFFNHMSPIHGLRFGEFHGLPSEQKTLLMRMISRCCEQAYRRGFQQGWDSKQRGDKVCNLEQWRFHTSLGLSPSPNNTYHDTSVGRLKIECPLYQVGLPMMEDTYLSKFDVETYITPLFDNAKKRRSLSKSLRFDVLRRDGFRCVYCGAKSGDRQLHVDHVMPRSLGGPDDMENLVTACDQCNLGKSNRHGDISQEIPNGR